jgi:multiple sugar transport system substrate-binding protein
MKRIMVLLVLALTLAVFLMATSTSIFAEKVSISFSYNSIKGGRGSQSAEWVEDVVVPLFEKEMKDKGRDVEVKYLPSGVAPEDWKMQFVLDVKGGIGPDVAWIDLFWVPELAEAKLLLPLNKYVEAWPIWDEYYDPAKKAGSHKDVVYGIMYGTDVRMIYYNKELFKKAGIAIPWQPYSWNGLLATARIIKEKLPGVIPLQINAGTDMGEATTMQGLYMVLLGAGGLLYDWDTNKWIIDSPMLRDTIDFYKQVYIDEKLGDAEMQVTAKSRDKTFEAFQQEKIAMLVEGTWFYSSVIAPNGSVPIPDRDERIGWAAMPGKGTLGTPTFACISGGTGFAINPNTKNADLSWELIKTALRPDVLVELFNIKPFSPIYKEFVELPTVKENAFIADTSKVLMPYTTVRPGKPEYPEISYQAQLLTEQIVTGVSPEKALENYGQGVIAIVGAENVEKLK